MNESTVSNPLTKHFRQPVIYVKLPSDGQFWPDGAISLPMNGEVAVLAMTSRDEISLKTPDALLNGAGVVSVIQSCFPSIHDAWKTPTIDVDSLIIAMRIATYGHQMDFDTVCPKCKGEASYAIDLRVVLSGIKTPDYNDTVATHGVTVKLRPQMYFEHNRSSQIEFEEQQLLRTIREESVDPDVRVIEFNKHMDRLLALNLANLVASIDSILTDEGDLVTDEAFISEFIQNSDSKVTNEIKAKLTEFADTAKIKPVDVVCTDEACAHKFAVEITFDYASFFVKGF